MTDITTDNNDILNKNTDIATAALDSERSGKLNSKLRVLFALGWRPASNTPIHIQFVKANGYYKTGSEGDIDTQSPYECDLGNYSAGDQVSIEWTLRAYSDMTGIRAFAKVGDGAWQVLDTKSPMADRDQWSSKAAITV